MTTIYIFQFCEIGRHQHGPPAADSQLSFFPNLPLLRSKMDYDVDNKSAADEKTDTCIKTASRHYTLTPCIFTVYCPHGVCVGFQTLTSHESPRHPFDIFLTRFPTPPSCIIYDNACKLHTYVLNREPYHYRNTMFLVDRLHYRKGHTSCTTGYSMDSYRYDRDTPHINSQINEQANVRLQRMKAQLSYMTPDNFMFHLKLYLSLTNDDIIIRQREAL